MKYQNPNIDGYMTEEELDWLFENAQKYSSILEVGSYKGKSTHALLSGTKGTVTAIEPFNLDLNPKSEIYIDKLRNMFYNNLKGFNNLKVLETIYQNTNTEPMEMTFLDFTTDYQETIKALNHFVPRTTKLICGHEYSKDWEGVVKAVDEVFGKPDGVVGMIWYKQL